MSNRTAYAISLGSGLVVWVGLMLFGNRKEGWDHPFYFSVGMPFLFLVALYLGYRNPVRVWRWGVLPMAAQAVVAILKNPTANLLPLGLVFLAFLSLPLIGGAYLGARLNRSRDADFSP